MHQVKLFKGVETEISQLEEQINDWIRQNNARILNISGNIAPQTPPTEPTGSLGGAYGPSDVLVIVHYETSSS